MGVISFFFSTIRLACTFSLILLIASFFIQSTLPSLTINHLLGRSTEGFDLLSGNANSPIKIALSIFLLLIPTIPMGSGVKTITLLEAQKEGLSVNSLWKEAEGLSIGVLGIIFLLQIGAYSSLCFVLHWLSNQQILRKVASAAKTIRARVGRSWVNNSHSQHSDTQMELTGPKNESSQTEMQSKFDINIQGNIYFQQVSAEKEGKQYV